MKGKRVKAGEVLVDELYGCRRFGGWMTCGRIR